MTDSNGSPEKRILAVEMGPNYIEDQALACDVAHAEYPNSMLAIRAKELGLQSEYDRNKQLAQNAGVVASRAYKKSQNPNKQTLGWRILNSDFMDEFKHILFLERAVSTKK